MTLSEFKSIFWFEYIHRMWGRMIGVAFILPGFYFIRQNYVSPIIKKRIILLSGMIGCQVNKFLKKEYCHSKERVCYFLQ